LDPDTPVEQQRVFFAATPEGNTLQWLLDGQPAGPAGAVLLWTPRRGRQTLALVDDTRRVFDSVIFEVRGSLTDSAREN
jgi:hypothetical protein